MNIIEKRLNNEHTSNKLANGVADEDAEKAIQTLLKWIGENPEREGLIETPRRVLNAYKEWFAGYKQNPQEILNKTFEEVNGYNQLVILKDIDFSSYCEHHFAPILGKVHIGYLPTNKIIGLSKLARLVDVFAKRLQVQERMTSQIANALQSNLGCAGVGVVVEAEHHCMCTRGIKKPGTSMNTSFFTGELYKNLDQRDEFLRSII